MSGGVLTDYRHDLYRLTEWSFAVQDSNPVLCELMRDMQHLLEEYDLYLSGDIGEERISKAWFSFSDEWMDYTDESMEARILDECRRTLRACVNGYKEKKEE